MQDLAVSTDEINCSPRTKFDPCGDIEITTLRRDYEIAEAKHELDLKRLYNKASTSYKLLQAIVVIALTLLIYGFYQGIDFFELVGSLSMFLFGGSAPTLFYRFKDRRSYLSNTSPVNSPLASINKKNIPGVEYVNSDEESNGTY